MNFRVLCAIGSLAAAAAAPLPVLALTVTAEECGEGADFVRNAALSRDNGMPAQAFLDRLEGDLVSIRTVPRALRWFARDEDDEALLRLGATSVFVSPREADDHHQEFLSHCRSMVAVTGAPRSSIDAAQRPR
jgi:hypothetical protein